MQYYHNPSCSKSRAALELLQTKGVNPEVYLYLNEKPSREEIVSLLEKLELTPHQLVRKSEPLHASLKLDSASDDDVIDAMAMNSSLIERPIFVSGSRAVIGRPPENVLRLLDE